MLSMAPHAFGSPAARGGGRTSARRLRAPVALLLTGVLALTACTGESPGLPDAAAQTPAAAAGEPAGTWPLTGLPSGDTVVRHPVMVVKIDNTQSSSPQVGLGSADLVAEELVEGGLTRLAAFFHKKVPTTVGPVRSMRATDIGIVKPADAVLVAAGGAPPTVRRIRKAKIKTFGEQATGFRRDSSRSAPYNLFVDLEALAGTVKARRAPTSYLPWGDGNDLPEGRPARGLAATFSDSHTTTWELRGGKYTNTDTYAGSDDQFRPDTVLVLRVRVGDAGYLDVAGHNVPETRFTGQGEALVFHDGRVVRATWQKELDTPISLRTKAGALRLPPGRVWIELVPRQGGAVSIRR